MRNPKRIDEIIDKISTLWKGTPDMRFYQFIISLTYEVYLDNPNVNDLFFLEDDGFISTLDRLIDKL